MESLELEIKQMIIEVMMLEDMLPEHINSAAPLFGEGLGLDSIDALELGVAIQKKYGVKLSSDATENAQYFSSIEALAKMISDKRQT